MTIEEIKQQLDFLSEKIDLINTNLQFNITTFLAILALAIAITGVALVLLVKNAVNKRVEIELSKKFEELKENIINEIRSENEKIQPILINGWRNIEGHQRLTYWKDKDGYVHLNGVVSYGVKTSNTLICIIQKEFAPNEDTTILVKTYNGIGKCIIKTDGQIIIDELNENKYIEFNSEFLSVI